jgi:hypothetical protein
MLRILFPLLLLATQPLCAQSGAARKISLNLCCLRHVGDVRSLLLKSDPASAPAEVPFYQGGFTEPVPALVENGKVVIYKKGTGEQPPWIPDWSFPVPATGSEISAILLPAPAKDGPAAPYSAFLLPAAKDFNYGAVLAVNLTPLNARLDLGTKKLSLTPGASGSANLESEADAYDMVPVTAWIQNDGKWLTLHTTQWSYNERYRQVSLIWMDPSAKRPEITSIRDVRPLPKPAE